jgi:hypothetical protein
MSKVTGCRLDGGVIPSQFRNSVYISTCRAALQFTPSSSNICQVPFSLGKANELLKPSTHPRLVHGSRICGVLPLLTIYCYSVGV